MVQGAFNFRYNTLDTGGKWKHLKRSQPLDVLRAYSLRLASGGTLLQICLLLYVVPNNVSNPLVLSIYLKVTCT